LTILKTELANEPALNSAKREQLNSQLTYDKVTPGTIVILRTTMDELREFYIDKYNKANEAKELKISKMTSGKEGEKGFLAMKNRYENESLEEMVRNSNQAERMVITDAKIIQRFEPVFHENPKEEFTKAPMFSYSKNVFGNKTGTLPANIFVIWMMSLVLYFTLQFDVLRKVLSMFSKGRK